MTRAKGLPFLVGRPIPSLDRDGKELGTSKVDQWRSKALFELTRCFGGAIPIPAPGANFVRDPETGARQFLYEEGQILVLAACKSREEFLAKRDRIHAFVDRMAVDLDPESVFVLAYPSDSFVIEIHISYEKDKSSIHRGRARPRATKEGERG